MVNPSIWQHHTPKRCREIFFAILNPKVLRCIRKNPFLCSPFKTVSKGFLAERLGTALQKLLQRFESAGNL